MKTIGIINGPNLNLTGKRETDLYGTESFEALLHDLKKEFPEVEIQYFQSNIEGELISCIQDWGYTLDAIILNAGGYTHTSVAIGDAVRAVSAPVIEVHLSNILAREEYRQVSYIAPAAIGIISGFGMDTYRMAFRFLLEKYY
ncbi:MAG: type II 3-dehydroquinate dehydratase [Bacteroidales bacterium]